MRRLWAAATTIAAWTAANVKARDAYHRHPNLDWCAWGDYHADDPPCWGEATSNGLCRGHRRVLARPQTTEETT